MEDIEKNTVDERICKNYLQNDVEDEIYYTCICDCSFYNYKRVKFFEYIRNTSQNFASLNSFDKIIWLMTCEINDIVNKFAELV